MDWKEAHAKAQQMANDCKLDVAIRKVYGGYSVHFASKNDNDYAIAEIVRPDGKEAGR